MCNKKFKRKLMKIKVTTTRCFCTSVEYTNVLFWSWSTFTVSCYLPVKSPAQNACSSNITSPFLPTVRLAENLQSGLFYELSNYTSKSAFISPLSFSWSSLYRAKWNNPRGYSKVVCGTKASLCTSLKSQKTDQEEFGGFCL